MVIDKKVLSEVADIKKELDEPYIEKMPISIMQNKGIVKGKEFIQFRVSIPKKFSDLVGLNKDDFNAEISLDKNNNKLQINITKNG